MGKIGFHLLVPPDQDRATSRQPVKSALNHPAPGRISFLPFLVEFLFADAPDMRRVVVFFAKAVAGAVVIGFVQTQVLTLPVGALRAFHDDGIERGGEQTYVGDVRPGDANRKWAAARLDKQALLDPGLSAVGRVGPDTRVGVAGPLF